MIRWLAVVALAAVCGGTPVGGRYHVSAPSPAQFQRFGGQVELYLDSLAVDGRIGDPPPTACVFTTPNGQQFTLPVMQALGPFGSRWVVRTVHAWVPLPVTAIGQGAVRLQEPSNSVGIRFP